MNLEKRRRTMSSINRRGAVLALLLVGIAGTGASEPRPASLDAAWERLAASHSRDEVLGLMEVTSAALQAGFHDEAASAIDRALLEIERYYGLTEDALKARSLWYEEGSKAFKGEPYERAMAHYYRGMLDLRLGDLDNARASFASAVLQDAFAEEEQYQSDFALMIFLAAWTAEKAGSLSLAEDGYARLAELRPDFIRPPPEHDTLVVIETGRSPRKLADGIGHGELVYRRDRKYRQQKVRLGPEAETEAYAMEDIFFQASTRGGREVDRILEGKVRFRNRTAGAGSALSDASSAFGEMALMTGDTQFSDIGAGLSVLGAMQTMVALNARPRADTRYWSGLPDHVHIHTFAAGDTDAGGLDVHVFNSAGEPEAGGSFRVPRLDIGNGNGLIWAVSNDHGKK